MSIRCHFRILAYAAYIDKSVRIDLFMISILLIISMAGKLRYQVTDMDMALRFLQSEDEQ